MISQDEKWLEIVVKSNNTFARVKDEIENRGVIPAFFESLLFSVKFNKSENIKQLVMKIFKSGFPEVVSSSLIDSFEHINIDVQLESASALENYPKIIENLKFLQINDDFKLIQSSLGNKVHIFVIFSWSCSCSGSLSVLWRVWLPRICMWPWTFYSRDLIISRTYDCIIIRIS